MPQKVDAAGIEAGCTLKRCKPFYMMPAIPAASAFRGIYQM